MIMQRTSPRPGHRLPTHDLPAETRDAGATPHARDARADADTREAGAAIAPEGLR